MFVKLHEQILNSSIMETALETRYLWMCLLVLADEEGIVDMTIHAIARRVNLTFMQVEKAIEEFCQPDASSRTETNEGRRLLPIRESFGWQIINYKHYRELRNREDRKEQNREAQKRHREKQSCQQPSATVSSRQQLSAESAQAEAEAEADTEKNDSSYEESAGADVDNPASGKNPDLDEFVKLAKEVTEIRIKKGFGDRLTFQIGQIIRGQGKTWAYGVEFLKVVQKGYMDCKDETIWRLWNSPPDSIMAQNTWEKTNIMNHEKLKKEIEERG